MATQIVMDRTGDTRHNFDAKNADALLKAEVRFRELTGAGFTAAVRAASGEAVVKRTFDPNAEETLFFPGSSAANLGYVWTTIAQREGASPTFSVGMRAPRASSSPQIAAAA